MRLPRYSCRIAPHRHATSPAETKRICNIVTSFDGFVAEKLCQTGVHKQVRQSAWGFVGEAGQARGISRVSAISRTRIAPLAQRSIILYGYTGLDMGALPASLDAIHPGLWRASQLGRASGRTVETGYAALSAELPGGGWPEGALVELLVQQTGIGELRLLAPALATVGSRALAFLRPPQQLNAIALPHIGVPVDKVLLLRPRLSADALWSAEQILKAGSCGALIFWQEAIRAESLRRLQLAARSGHTLFFVVRPLIRATDPSPAELRLTIRPSADGVTVEVIKRKGPSMAGNVKIELRPSPLLLSPHRRAARVSHAAIATLSQEG